MTDCRSHCYYSCAYALCRELILLYTRAHFAAILAPIPRPFCGHSMLVCKLDASSYLARLLAATTEPRMIYAVNLYSYIHAAIPAAIPRPFRGDSAAIPTAILRVRRLDASSYIARPLAVTTEPRMIACPLWFRCSGQLPPG